MVEPDVIELSKGIILISSDEDETQDNDDKILKDLSIVDGCILKVDDFFQNYELTITIVHKDAGRDDAAFFEVVADPDLIKPTEINTADKIKVTTKEQECADENGGPAEKIRRIDLNDNGGNGSAATKKDDGDDDDICILEESINNAISKDDSVAASSSSSLAAASSSIKSPPKKRKTTNADAEESGPSNKRSKLEDDDDLILIDDD